VENCLWVMFADMLRDPVIPVQATRVVASDIAAFDNHESVGWQEIG
jgi:hypothetical protein